jgi:hypothetical protein
VSAKGIYLETVRTYWQRAGFLLLVGALVFVPLGALDALANEIGEVRVEHLGDLADLAVAALALGVIAQATTSLLGEVFYSGAVALTLVRREHGLPPGLVEIARSLSYGRLIAVDILFGAAVAIGLLLLVAPGVLVFTWFALAGPLVEIEDDRVRSAFARSRRLVRGRFWTVLAVLAPIALANEALTSAALSLSHDAIHHEFLAAWIGESATNVVLSPFYAVAAVLITLELRGLARGGGDPARAARGLPGRRRHLRSPPEAG